MMKITYRHYRFSKYPQPLCEEFTGRHGTAYHYQRGVEKVYNEEQRVYAKARKTMWEPLPRGGYTLCVVYDDNEKELAFGVAECSPKDSFCYRMGRTVAQGRLVQNLFEQADADLVYDIFTQLGWDDSPTLVEFLEKHGKKFDRFACRVYFMKGSVGDPRRYGRYAY